MTFPKCFTVCAALIGLVVSHSANAQINGFKANPRVFNDNPGSTLTITPPAPINVNPANITIQDVYTGAFGGANRHDVLASGDGGLTAYNFSLGSSFMFTTRVTLTAGDNAPRKEAGIRMNGGPIGDMLFLVNSDAGEIVTFGGPFHLFGKNSTGNGYTPGTSILLGIIQKGGNGITPSTTEFFIDRGFGIETTGPLAWTNLEGGLPSYQLGVYAQGGSDGGAVVADYINAVFTGTTLTVPEPSTLTLVALGLFGVWGLRRKQQV